MKIVKPLIILSLLFQVCLGHEFWLQPRNFREAGKSATFPIDIRVGMNFEGKAWGGDLGKILELAVYHDGERRDLLEASSLEKPVIDLTAEESGQYLVGFTNESAFIELKADDFKKYVLSEGLESIVEQRKKLGESDEPGKEFYRRCAKTLVQRGDDNSSKTYQQRFGFPLELTALTNPYDAEATPLQTFQLTYQETPLQNAQVVVWNKDGERVNRREPRTDKDGKISFPLKRAGKWMVSTVHMVRIEGESEADWQSYWGSFTFGF